MLERFKKISRFQWYTITIFAFLVIQPIIELDYLLNDFFKEYHLIVPSTFIRFGVLILLGILGYIVIDNRKKFSFLLLGSFSLLVILYTIGHLIGIKALAINLPENFRVDMKIELKYILILTLPFIMMYCTSLANFNRHQFNRIIIIVSTILCSVIFVTDLFVISFGSYGGMTQANFISWFTDGYHTYNDAKMLMSKGWYQAANVLGALLLMLLPLLYKVLYEAKRKWPIILLLILQSLCMFMVGTRVATFGVILVTVAVFIANLGCVILKLAPLNFKFLLAVISIFGGSLIIYPYSPAVKYQEYNSQMIHDLQLEETKQDTVHQMGVQLENLSADLSEEERKVILAQILRDNAQLLTFPSIYYDESYPIEFDPDFWADVVSQPFELRSDGRKLQKLFSIYKWEMMSSKEKLFGMGFSTLSEGELILEQDGWRQLYTMGVLGLILFVSPYLILILGATVNALKNFTRVVNFSNLMLLLAATIGLGAGYYSGHVLDELFTNLFLGFITITLFINTNLSKDSEEREG